MNRRVRRIKGETFSLRKDTMEAFADRIKRQNPAVKIVLFRVGDFYEAFGADAQLMADTLNLIAPRNGMAGFPAITAGMYCQQLADAGYPVARIDTPAETFINRES